MTLPFDIDPQQARDALRLGLQSATAAVLCFLILGLIGSDEQFVGVLSAVLIVQPSIGRTVSEGWERLGATVIGSLVGLLCLFLLPKGYGVAIALALLMFVMNFIASFRAEWRYGVVAAVALALAENGGNLDIAQARAVSIGIGILIGIAVSFIVWPESAPKRGLRHRRNALNAAADRFAAALRDEADNNDASDSARRRFHAALSAAREVVSNSKTEHAKRLKQTFECLEELYNSIILIDRVESPLSLFSDAVIDRCDLVTAGRDAITALSTDDDNHAEKRDEALAAFSKAVDDVEAGLSEHELDNSGKHAASVVFGLREMERSMQEFCDRNKTRKPPSLSQHVTSSVKSIVS